MSDRYDDDYDDDSVGYKKPPKKSQFQKGKSGNPKGRPPKKMFHQTFIEALDEEVTVTIAGEKVTMPIKEAILKKLLVDSVNGKHSATRNFIDIMKSLRDMPLI